MIEIKQVSAINIEQLPELLNEYSKKEFLTHGVKEAATIIHESECVWCLHEGDTFLAVAGVYRAHMIGEEPVFWFLAGAAFSARHVRQMQFVREALREQYSELVTWIESGAVRQEKFAKHFGFQQVTFNDLYSKYRMTLQ